MSMKLMHIKLSQSWCLDGGDVTVSNAQTYCCQVENAKSLIHSPLRESMTMYMSHFLYHIPYKINHNFCFLKGMQPCMWKLIIYIAHAIPVQLSFSDFLLVVWLAELSGGDQLCSSKLGSKLSQAGMQMYIW